MRTVSSSGAASNAPATIILLNGVGSAGKSSIAKALQKKTAEPFLHVEMDAFIAMMPENPLGHPDGLCFPTISDDGKPVIAIERSPVAQRGFRGMQHAIAALAAQGNNLIVDLVLLDGDAAAYAELLRPFRLHQIGIFAPLDLLEAREIQRADRLIGLARWQYDRVHREMNYDLELDTSITTPSDCADLILKTFGLVPVGAEHRTDR